MKRNKRRIFLQQMLGGALGGTLLNALPSISFGQAAGKKFLLRVHLGSWCGWSSGLLQPKDVGVFPKGVFFRNQDSNALNPNLNTHFKDGNLIFNDYSKPLLNIADHVCFAAGNARSVSHNVARLYQNTGDRKVGATANPSWAVGLAQASNKSEDIAFAVRGSGGGEGKQTSKTTPKVVTLDAATIAEVANNFSDHASIRDLPQKDLFTKYSEENLANFQSAVSNFSREERVPLINAVSSISKGIENINSLESQITNFINTNTIRKHTDEMDDNQFNSNGTPLDGVSDRLANSYEGFVKQFQTAALLIEGGIASGMTISLDNQDFHTGNAESITARSSGCVWAMITRFWEWVVSKGYENDVMICASHEFSRTPYNGSRGAQQTIFHKDANGRPTSTSITNPGRDHHISFGMMFVNGNVPSKGRIGGILDGYAPAGGDGLTGVGNPEKPSYSSTQLVGSMMMRCWSDIFPNYRAVRDIFPNFLENQQISEILS